MWSSYITSHFKLMKNKLVWHHVSDILPLWCALVLYIVLVIQVSKSYSKVLLHCVQSLFGKEADKLEHANDDEKICILCCLPLQFCIFLWLSRNVTWGVVGWCPESCTTPRHTHLINVVILAASDRNTWLSTVLVMCISYGWKPPVEHSATRCHLSSNADCFLEPPQNSYFFPIVSCLTVFGFWFCTPCIVVF